MVKPYILLVDDEQQVLSAIRRDVQKQYSREYRVIAASSGSQALESVQQLKQRDEPVALFLVDQRMPGMTGVEFLTEARRLYPDACKVLLTAYADTEAAVTSINTVGLNYYLSKPWDPPEHVLYPVLDDLLDEWAKKAPVPYDGIRVAGTLWSAACHNVKDFLARNHRPYKWLDIERDPEARAMVEGVTGSRPALPVVFFPDGSTLIRPDDAALAEKLNMQRQASQPFYDLIVVGGGPAGLAAAVYGASEGLRTIMIERAAAGGQAGTSSRIENYLGFPNGLSGADLARRATTQALRLGAEILSEQAVTGVRVEDPYRVVTLQSGDELSCHVLLIASGVSYRKLDVPGAEAVTGAGIYYGAAVTEAAHYAGQHVYVLGGANSAGQGAIFLSRYASQVTMLVRGDTLQANMSQYLIDQIAETENIEVCTQTRVVGVRGADRLEAIVTTDSHSEGERERPAAALFNFIGASAHTDWIAGAVERDQAGFVLTGPDLARDGRRPRNWRLARDPFPLETSVPGIFAAGDVRHGSVKRVAAAVGEGAVALQLTREYLKTV